MPSDAQEMKRRGTEVKAEMTGNLWKIVSSIGDAVEEDDTLMILESMKMEIPVTAPVAGKVSEICVEEGQVVQEGDTVAVIE
jgi:biotin carboxyl carrier protein